MYYFMNFYLYLLQILSFIVNFKLSKKKYQKLVNPHFFKNQWGFIRKIYYTAGFGNFFLTFRDIAKKTRAAATTIPKKI